MAIAAGLGLDPQPAQGWLFFSRPRGFENPADFDRDGVSNVSDKCLLTADASQGDSDGDGVGDACDGKDARLAANQDEDLSNDVCSAQGSGTMRALLGLNEVQLQQVFTASYDRAIARHGEVPMPSYPNHDSSVGLEASGAVLWEPDYATLNDVERALTFAVWTGKIWYVDQDGGFLVNTMFGLAEVPIVNHDVYRAVSPIDGRPGIQVQPRATEWYDWWLNIAAWDFFDTVRQIEPGVYLGYSMSRTLYVDIQRPFTRPARVLNFSLDFNCPEYPYFLVP